VVVIANTGDPRKSSASTKQRNRDQQKRQAMPRAITAMRATLYVRHRDCLIPLAQIRLLPMSRGPVLRLDSMAGKIP